MFLTKTCDVEYNFRDKFDDTFEFQDGVITAEEAEKCMIHGIGMRYAILGGPFSVEHLTTGKGKCLGTKFVSKAGQDICFETIV